MKSEQKEAVAAGASLLDLLEVKEYGGCGYGCRGLEGHICSFDDYDACAEGAEAGTVSSVPNTSFIQPLLRFLAMAFLLSGCSDDPLSDADSQQATAASMGQITYNRWCVSCHLSGASGAPRLAAAEDWQDRLPKGREALLRSVIQGLGVAMPARGLCRSCSDQELEQTLDYMLGTLSAAEPAL